MASLISSTLTLRPDALASCASSVVLLEKPITPTYAQAKELVDLAKSKGLILAPFQNRRWDSDFLGIQEILKKGEVSTKRRVAVTYRPRKADGYICAIHGTARTTHPIQLPLRPVPT